MPVLLLALLLPAADPDAPVREKTTSPDPADRREAVTRWATRARLVERVWQGADRLRVPEGEPELAPRFRGPGADHPAHRFPALILAHMLGDPDADVRAAAALGIQESSAFGLPGAGPVLPVGVALARIDDPNPRVRFAAALVLSGAGAEPARAVPVLLEALADPKRPLAVETIEAVGAFGPAVPGWAALRLAERLGAEDNGLVRAAAADALRDIGPGARAALPLLSAGLESPLESPDAWVAVAAAEAVWRITGRAEELPGALERGIRSPRRRARTRALTLVSEIGPDARNWAEPLVRRALPDKDAKVRDAAVAALLRLGLPTDDLIAEFERLGGSEEDANAAIAGLRRVGFPALPALLRLIHAHPEAVEAAAGFGVEAVPFLIGMLRRGGDHHARGAAEALGRIGAPAAGDLADLVAGDGPRRNLAARALALIGRAAADDASDALVRGLADPDEDVRRECISAVGRVAAPARAAAELLRLWDGADPEVRGLLAEALGNAGPASRAAVPGLLESCGGDDDLGAAARTALVRITGSEAEAVAYWLSRVAAPEASDRSAALAAAALVATRTPSDRKVAAAAGAALDDADAGVRRAALRALQRLDLPAHLWPAVRRMAADPDEGNRQLALFLASRGLGSSPQAREVFFAAFAHPDKDVRADAANWLAPDIHERKLTDVLLRLIADPEPEVAVPAICRLARDFGPDAPEELRKAIAARAVKPPPGVRSAVAEAMESMRRR